MGRDRIATLCELKYRTRLWNKAADGARRKINWRFTTADARRVFRYRQGTYAWAEKLKQTQHGQSGHGSACDVAQGEGRNHDGTWQCRGLGV